MNRVRILGNRARLQLSKLPHPGPRRTFSSTIPHLVNEEPSLYGEGGFHPISLGDTFDAGRYEVLRKLGYGQYSTVWLARDFKHQRFVAIKALRADRYGKSERDILSKISDISASSNHEGRHFILQILRRFNHVGPNGGHTFFVFDVLGHHLYFQCSKYEDGRLPVQVVKTIARQLLLGLDFLHRECNIVHTDIHPKNVLLELKDPNTAISKHLSEVSPRTDTKSGETFPLREVIETPLIAEMEAPCLKIIDFGAAKWRGKNQTYQIQPVSLRAPEVIIGAPWDTGVDIWTLGCLIVEFVQGIVLFLGEASKDGTWTVDDDRLAKIIEVFGPFPPELLERGTRTADFFDENGDLRRIPKLKPTTLENLLNGPKKPFSKPDDMPEADVPLFINFIRGMLAIDPERRSSAADLVKHEWLKR
ncbi:CMGC/SRPK protein kinase [Helicocarpus griseus UAMH5409]|uniref:non-specific serine/threonine protein kinase n=1 Tax=Helicocarpus griseus UAMH5409 TaxID=1447875 RepID=A0A2B7WS31_9EURO|nr:CMGC/SRPK protein kinase [Helicocarpus griseus UAMH5409]